MKKDRILYLDDLRVIATISVIVLHVTAMSWYEPDVRGLEWNILHFYNGICRWGVGVFVMISGSLFLERDIPMKKLYGKYIARMVAAYCVWSGVYAIALPFVKARLIPGYEISFAAIPGNLVVGAYHMWFIPMIIGLYMCLPLLRQLVKSESCTRYYLLLSFVFAFLLPQAVTLICDFVGGRFANGFDAVNSVMSDLGMEMVLGFGFYFVLGYCLGRAELSEKQQKGIALLGVVGLLLTLALNAAVSWKTREPLQTYFGNHTANVALTAMAVFTWFRCKPNPKEKQNALLAQLSKYSFGIYLVHVFVIEVLAALDLNALSFSPLLSVPVITALVMGISFLIAFAIGKIPVIGKWIV